MHSFSLQYAIIQISKSLKVRIEELPKLHTNPSCYRKNLKWKSQSHSELLPLHPELSLGLVYDSLVLTLFPWGGNCHCLAHQRGLCEKMFTLLRRDFQGNILHGPVPSRVIREDVELRHATGKDSLYSQQVETKSHSHLYLWNRLEFLVLEQKKMSNTNLIGGLGDSSVGKYLP